jgi:hypothetical protein
VMSASVATTTMFVRNERGQHHNEEDAEGVEEQAHCLPGVRSSGIVTRREAPLPSTSRWADTVGPGGAEMVAMMQSFLCVRQETRRTVL